MKPLDRKEWHASITDERVTETVQRSTFGLENAGICLACGEEAEGCEPDARNYRCETCGQLQVFGAEEVLLMMVA